jgi:hypothetical protein
MAAKDVKAAQLRERSLFRYLQGPQKYSENKRLIPDVQFTTYFIGRGGSYISVRESGHS